MHLQVAIYNTVLHVAIVSEQAMLNKTIVYACKTAAYANGGNDGMIVAYEVSSQDIHRPLSFGLLEGARKILKTFFYGLFLNFYHALIRAALK